MALADVFFGKSEETREAERELRHREDRLMALHPEEETSLGRHVRADAERMNVMLGRLRVVQTVNETNANRNLSATVLSGIALIAVLKGGTVIEFLAKVIAAL